jgi:hypothetical protein
MRDNKDEIAAIKRRLSRAEKILTQFTKFNENMAEIAKDIKELRKSKYISSMITGAFIVLVLILIYGLTLH